MLADAGFIESDENGKLVMPFAEIRVELVLRQDRAA
jgi:hypothetical protein